MLPEPDVIRLRHMLDAVREARGYVRGKSREDLDRNTMLFRALVNCIEIVGEAAANVSGETRTRAPDSLGTDHRHAKSVDSRLL